MNGKRVAQSEYDEAREGLVRSVAGQIEGALNDHSVGIAQAIRDAAPHDTGIERGLRDVARAIDNLAEAIREGNARR